MLDKAVTRPGRFDKIINVSVPDIDGREEIFAYYLNKIKYDKENVKSRVLASATSSMTGADIKNLVNIAVLNCIKEGRKQAIHNDFEFAIDRIAMGKKSNFSNFIRYWKKEYEGFRRGQAPNSNPRRRPYSSKSSYRRDNPFAQSNHIASRACPWVHLHAPRLG